MLLDSEAKDVKEHHRAVSDMVGIGLSLLCLIHCLALPVLIAFAPAILRGLPGDDVTHRGLAVAIGSWVSWHFALGTKCIVGASCLRPS